LRLLHLLPSVNPSGGGPIENVRQLGAQMRKLGHQFDVITLDAPDEAFVKDFPLPLHALGPSISGYRYNIRLVKWLKSHLQNYDAIVVNGLWRYNSFGAWRALQRASVPYYVFTHGMLDPWFRRNYPLKHFKKWLYWPWAEYRVLRDARAVMFTSEEERLQARRSFWLYRVKEQVIAYGTKRPPSDAEKMRRVFFDAHPELVGRRILLFLGRIHEKKGCDLLIDAFSKVCDADPLLQLVIAGPDQTGWVAKLKAAAQQLKISDRVSWPGMLRGDMKWGAFYASEAFVLPSHQENFGIAVAEALGCGTPVLISDKVNIWREIQADGVGLVESDTGAGTEKLFARWLSMTAEERKAMSHRALGCFESRFTVDAMATDLLRVYKEMH
jgi:glycosyltransferase involved in cell wall biosynthesis